MEKVYVVVAKDDCGKILWITDIFKKWSDAVKSFNWMLDGYRIGMHVKKVKDGLAHVYYSLPDLYEDIFVTVEILEFIVK